MSSTSIQRPLDVTKEWVQPMNMYVPQQDDDWTSDVYDRLNGARRQRKTGVHCTVRRACITCFSSPLVAFGATICTFMVMAMLTGQPLLLCFYANSTLSMLAGMALGVFVLLAGIVGVASAWCETRVSAVLFSLLVAFLALLTLGTGVIVVLLYTTMISQSTVLAHVWEGAVQNDPRVVCDLQDTLHCSGYLASQCCVSNRIAATDVHGATPCYLIAEDGTTTLDPKTLMPVTWPLHYCVPACNASNIYSDTCERPLNDQFTNALPHTIAVLFVTGTVLVTLSILAASGSSAAQRPVSFYRYEY